MIVSKTLAFAVSTHHVIHTTKALLPRNQKARPSNDLRSQRHWRRILASLCRRFSAFCVQVIHMVCVLSNFVILGAINTSVLLEMHAQ